MIKKFFFLTTVSTVLFFHGYSQVSIKDSSIFMTVIYATYSYQFPGGDLAKLYGSNSSIGGGLMFKTKFNLLIGGEGNFLFGGTVKNANSLMKNISTPDGYVMDANGYYADISYLERGFSIYLKFGYIIPVFKSNPNTGLTIIAGGGFLQNKIRIHNPGNTVTELLGDYKKGYDRLNSGFGVNGSIGYTYFSENRLVNLYLGFECIQSWTKNKREYFFDTGKRENINYSSQYYGIKVKWMIPLYKRAPKAYYLY